jgi:hypothetical protein
MSSGTIPATATIKFMAREQLPRRTSNPIRWPPAR